MTGRPAALRALALASTARVADSVMAAMRAETRRAGATMAPHRPTAQAQVALRPGSGGRPLVRPRLRARPYTRGPGGLPPCASVPETGSGGAGRVPRPKGRSSIGQSPGLQNRWLGVRVPPALHRAPDASSVRQRTAGTERWRTSEPRPASPQPPSADARPDDKPARACAAGRAARRCSSGRSSPSCARSSGRPAASS